MDRVVIENALIESAGDCAPIIITGGAKGADFLADDIACQRGWGRKVFQADWHKHGKSAGPVRNMQMLAEGGAQLVIAFWDGKSTGTAHMISIAQAAGLGVRVFGMDGTETNREGPLFGLMR